MESIIRKIEALLNTNGCTEQEAQTRTAKAQELLEKYNLDMASLGKSGKGAQRSDTKKSGGLYAWQRRLWNAVAELNFCHYFSLKGNERGAVYEHRIIGSHANVIGTEMMAKYLQDTVERLAQQWAKENFYKSVFVREAIAYREGMAARITERLNERRRLIVEEERVKQEARKQEERENSAAPGSTALTILDVISTEADLNTDYLNNWEPGTTARNRVEREAKHAAWRAQHAEKQAAYDRWKAANPEEAARKEAELEAENKAWWEKYKMEQSRAAAPRTRKPTAEEERQGLSSFYQGRRAGDDVGLDRQADHDKRKAIL